MVRFKVEAKFASTADMRRIAVICNAEMLPLAGQPFAFTLGPAGDAAGVVLGGTPGSAVKWSPESRTPERE